MNNKWCFRFLLPFLIITTSIFSQNQNIYLPQNMNELYTKGETRSWNGKPGENYWVNKIDYDIKAELNPDSISIKGTETITYYNNSPDTLKSLVIQLFQNLYQKGAARDFNLAPQDITNGVNISYIDIDDVEITERPGNRGGFTNFVIRELPKPIAPNSSAKINLAWESKLPQYAQVRMGKYTDGVLFSAYWYPKIAVYDDIYGWDRNQYFGSAEFYSDFGDYNVELTVPDDYIIWATGSLLNADENLQKDVYEKYVEALSSDKVIRIITPEDYEEEKVTIKSGKNTWKFFAENVPDFSFATSSFYLWDGTSFKLDENLDKRIFTDVVYKEGSLNFEEAAQISKESIIYLSTDLPGISFPYPKFTSFANTNRGGGMETPMMANDGVYRTRSGHIGVINHEVAHTYFPFATGINERRNAWIDEGLTTFFNVEFVEKYEPDYSHYNWMKNFYKFAAGASTDENIPIMVPASSAREKSLTNISYARPFFAFIALKDYLGDKLFKKSIREFYKRWEGKHPLPYDFFFTFNDVTKEDLSWFWNPWFYKFAHTDLGLEKAEKNSFKILLVGKQPVPVKVVVTFEDDSEETIIKNTAEWKNGNEEIIISLFKNIKSVKFDNEKIMDINSSNDQIDF